MLIAFHTCICHFFDYAVFRVRLSMMPVIRWTSFFFFSICFFHNRLIDLVCCRKGTTEPEEKAEQVNPAPDMKPRIQPIASQKTQKKRHHQGDSHLAQHGQLPENGIPVFHRILPPRTAKKAFLNFTIFIIILFPHFLCTPI